MDDVEGEPCSMLTLGGQTVTGRPPTTPQVLLSASVADVIAGELGRSRIDPAAPPTCSG